MATRFEQIAERASEQHGLVTPADAVELGFDPSALRVMTRNGSLVHLAAGLYRVPLVPETELTAYMEAVLWTRGTGVVSHASALAIRGYGDFSEPRIHLTVPKGTRIRKAGPSYYRLWHRDLRADEMTLFEGIPVTAVLTAIRDSAANGSDPHQLRLAAREAFRDGNLSEAEYRAARRIANRRIHAVQDN